ncbi:MAG: hypothetical protein ACREBR_03700, partial [bacterium]
EADALSRLHLNEKIDQFQAFHDAYIYNPAYDLIHYYPLDYELINVSQQEDQELLGRVALNPENYRHLPFHDFDLICSIIWEHRELSYRRECIEMW